MTTSSSVSTLHHRGSAADACRERGWGVGTRLVGDEGYGPTVIEITAVGDSEILARRLAHDGWAVAGDEGSWVLWCRDWREATDTDVPAPLPSGTRVVLPEPPHHAGVVESGPDRDGFYIVDCGDAGRRLVKQPPSQSEEQE